MYAPSSGSTNWTGNPHAQRPSPSPSWDPLYQSFHDIFTKTNVLFFLFFLAVYFCLYYLLGLGKNGASEGITAATSSGRWLDFFVLIIILFACIYFYYTLPYNDKRDLIGYTIQATENYFNDPTTPFSLVILILIFYFTIYVTRISMTPETKPLTVHFLESKLLVLLGTVLIFDFFHYVLGINLSDIIFGTLLRLWEHVPREEEPRSEAPAPLPVAPPMDPSHNNVVAADKREVFNVSNNLYTYEDAQAVCKAFDSRLATYEEIENSYNDGGEWCNYGWSDGQMILFPTQKATWDQLQKSPEHKNDCGRPGINGGYMENSTLQFGVNCFGIKPKPSALEHQGMLANKQSLAPKSKDDLVQDAKVAYWKNHKDRMVQLNPFNREQWQEKQGP